MVSWAPKGSAEYVQTPAVAANGALLQPISHGFVMQFVTTLEVVMIVVGVGRRWHYWAHHYDSDVDDKYMTCKI